MSVIFLSTTAYLIIIIVEYHGIQHIVFTFTSIPMEIDSPSVGNSELRFEKFSNLEKNIPEFVCISRNHRVIQIIVIFKIYMRLSNISIYTAPSVINYI